MTATLKVLDGLMSLIVFVGKWRRQLLGLMGFYRGPRLGTAAKLVDIMVLWFGRRDTLASWFADTYDDDQREQLIMHYIFNCGKRRACAIYGKLAIRGPHNRLNDDCFDYPFKGVDGVYSLDTERSRYIDLRIGYQSLLNTFIWLNSTPSPFNKKQAALGPLRNA